MNNIYATRTLYRAVCLAALLAACLPSLSFAQALSAPPTTIDVGMPMIPGYATYANQTYTVSGAGTGIGGAVDQFSFAYRALTGDGTIIARVGSLENATRYAQVGVMMRESFDGRSKHASLLMSRTNELMFKRRTTFGRATRNLTLGSRLGPIWLKLDRTSSTFTASWSDDGSTWTVIGSDTVSMSGVVYVGLAVTSFAEVAATKATFGNVVIKSLADSGSSLPTGWSSEDIGAPGHPGVATYNAGTFALMGGGTDVAKYSDQFHYAYTQVDGDVDVVARVRAIGSEWSKVGVMVRDSLTPNGSHASMFFANAVGTAFQRRPLPGGSTLSTKWVRRRAPVWLKLSVRSGDVTGYESLDGISWTLVGQQRLTLPSPFYVGLAVSSRDNTTLVTTNLDNVAVRAAVDAENQKPTVTLTAPAAVAALTAPATITVAAAALDPDGSIARVDFYADETLLGSDTTSPYAVSWQNVVAGRYAVTAVAVDDEDASTSSASRVITVNAPVNQPPTVALVAPAHLASYTAPATVVVSADARDGDGTIARVDFYRGTTLIGSDATAPYSVTWTGAGAGTYSLTARALDNAGATTVSAARSITVAATSTSRRAVFAASPDHDRLVTSYVLEIFASGVDPATAVPIASRNLGKPAVVNGECTADVSATFNALAPGAYQATVAAVATTGSARSAPVPFTR